MNLPKKNKAIIVITVLAITLFFGCESNFKDVQKINFSEFFPAGETIGFNIKYTDSGRITAILKGKKMLDYSNLDFPFTEFPKGINLTLYDKNQKRTFITANYAVSYKNTGIVDLVGKVRIKSELGALLETEQLYFDQKNEWFCTEKKFKLTDPKGISNGQGIDFSKDLKVINSQRITGEIEADK